MVHAHDLHSAVEYSFLIAAAFLVYFSWIWFVQPVGAALFLRFFSWFSALLVRFQAHITDLETRRAARTSHPDNSPFASFLDRLYQRVWNVPDCSPGACYCRRTCEHLGAPERTP